MDNKEVLELLESLEGMNPSGDQQDYISGMRAAITAIDKGIGWDDALNPLENLREEIRQEERQRQRDFEMSSL